jgi:hypothetical protein
LECSGTPEVKKKIVTALEDGNVVYFPNLPFVLNADELKFLSPHILSPGSKNISYDHTKDVIAGTQCASSEETEQLKQMIKRYSTNARQFLDEIIPHYNTTLIQAKTSFRPVEIQGRKSSAKKDDTRLHVDAFPSNPTKGQRILRLFTNINADRKPRVWRIGEPFQDVVKNFGPRTSSPIFGVAELLKLLKITKSKRSSYDHYMLQIHDMMKLDDSYQKNVSQQTIEFPPGATWMVYTDQTSHAAMSGQHVLEQTFHMPVEGLNNPETSPLKVLEKYYKKKLI